MNQYGVLGGSNIVNEQTLGGNIIPDGEFESINSLNQNWNLNYGSGTDYVTTLTDSIKVEGDFSLYNKNPKAYRNGTINTCTILNLNKPLYLATQKTYRLSGWFKAKGEFTDIGGVFVDINQSQNGLVHLRFEPVGSDSVNTEWTFIEQTFFVPNEDLAQLLIYIPIEEVWIDNLVLTQSE